MAEPFFTIGHSTRPIAEFVDLLRSAEIRLLADVRKMPRSRTNPQYNRETLPAALAAHGIGYAHLAALGGLRGKARDVAPQINGFWEHASFHNYADYALSAAFCKQRRSRAGHFARNVDATQPIH